MNWLKKIVSRIKPAVCKQTSSKTKKVLYGLVSVALAASFVAAPNVAQYVRSSGSNSPRFNFLQGDLELLTAANVTKHQADWSDPVSGQYSADIGDQIVFRFYFHNGIEDSVAKNTILRAQLSNEISTEQKVYSFLSADNASLVTDTVVDGKIVGSGAGYTEINLNTPGRLEYVPGSTKIWRENPKEQGVQLADGITSGNGLNIGDISGCWQYAGYVTFKTVVKAPAQITISKSVAYPNTSNWSPVLENTKEGQVIAWKVNVENQGQTVADNVLVKDALPSQLTYINGSTISNGPDTPAGGIVMPDTLVGSGLTVSEIKPGIENAVSFIFQTKINSNLSYNANGISEAINYASAIYNNQEVKASAKVIVVGQAGMTIEKQVQLSDCSWGEQSFAKIGDKINYRITIKNIAEQNLTNIKINDVIPVFTYYVAGSTKVDGQSVTDGITINGINLGTLARGQTMTIELSVITYGCPPIGDYTLTNAAYVSSDQLATTSDIARTILHLDPVVSPSVGTL